ncbi:winged helix-turn-helix domain-containing protein [Oceanisphaera arctica]|uniref:DNA-binding response regulator n=1 Tax=Oceanisphaera arctica TaxID=641510 RepID=A0A2P5TRS4_9GAMM|nr:response regulator transcription factor [Oceanisphaera arctica]PPL18529.1 DNA-binding response regulator [Oceanisphaera arctica]GHA17145.1 DNA-binding response regulator [Oceanisphaera arctica]
MELLLVEDDPKIADFIHRGLGEQGYRVRHYIRAEEAALAAREREPVLAIVDIMLPGQDGLSLVQQWRGQGMDFPILMLSARRSVDDRVQGLRLGGDDYLTKPFAFSELLARVEVLLRRSSRLPHPPDRPLQLADLSLDPLGKQARRAGQKLQLQPREYVLLELLLRHQGRVLSRTQILEQVWDYRFDPQTNVVDVLICRLRNKLDKDHPQKLLHTLRGIGYVLRID